jgi:hypothetical protein
MTTHRLVTDFRVCVPRSQADDYAAVVGKARVWTHPDTVVGLTPKLNWILDQEKDTPVVVLLDDDLTKMIRCFNSPGEGSVIIREPDRIEAIIHHTARLAADLGAKLFGWAASDGSLRYYDGLKPFSLSGYINGCATGFLRGHGLRYDERIVAKNDYDICALNAYQNRYCFKNARYNWAQTATFTGRGGQAAHRNSETEQRDVRLLLRKWGPEIIRQGGYSATRKRDYAGVAKVTLHLPF